MSKPTQGLAIALAVAALTHTADAQSLTTTLVASGFSNPTFLTAPAGDTNRLFVTEQNTGRIEIIKNGTLLATPFLTVTGMTTGGERGLLGLAFHPDFATNGQFFVSYTGTGGANRIARYTVTGTPLTNDVADASSADVIMTISQPQSNHNGGCIGFGPDGYLYFGVGDGGGAGDTSDLAQNPNTLLGKMLRIDVDGDDFPADTLRDYAIPPGQPSFGGLPELWMIGLRNPWRWSFDSDNGDMWIGDVGQNAREEIDLDEGGVGGQNWGWKCKEGFSCFGSSAFCACMSTFLTDPVFDYSHALGFSVTGGYVYRGPLTCLQGTYFFADFGGRIWSAEKDGLGGVNVTDRTTEFAIPGTESISSFGQDAEGNLYICDFTGGEIFKIDLTSPCAPPPTELCNGDGGDQMGCTNCPCGNNAAIGTLGGCLNSAGSSARLLGSSFPSVSLNNLRFEATGCPANAFTVLLSGDAVAPTGMANPCFGLDSGVQSTLYDGLRCAVQNTIRHGGRPADAFGQVGITNNGWGLPDGPNAGIIGQGGFVAGQTRVWQLVNRDDPMLNCMRGLNTSQGVLYTITP